MEVWIGDLKFVVVGFEMDDWMDSLFTARDRWRGPASWQSG